MPTGIIGAGAMGSLFAYFFHKTGESVRLLEADLEIVRSLEKGLSVEIDQKVEKIPITISMDPAILAECGTIFLFVKSYSTERAAETVKNHLPENALIVSLQNGLGNIEALLKHFPRDRVLYGATTIGSTKLAPNRIRFGGQGTVILGGENKKNAESVISLLQGCGIDARYTGEPDKTVWEKAVINAGINPIGALLAVTNGDIPQDPHCAELQKDIIFEAAAVARSRGIDLAADELLSRTQKICAKTAMNRCSMLQDIDAGKKTEIDSITGMIVDFGREAGLPTPVNKALYHLIKAREEIQTL